MTELEEAYNTVFEAEKKLLNEITAAANIFKDKLTELKSNLPEKGSSSAARQFLINIEAQISGQMGYELTRVQGLYGINNATPIIPAQP